MNPLPPDTPVTLDDSRVPDWVRAAAEEFEGVCYVAYLPPPDDGEWWLLDNSGDLIEAVWLES